MTPEQIADIRARFVESAGTSDDTLAIVALLGEVERLQALVGKIQVQVDYWWPQWKRELLGAIDEALSDEKLEDIRAHIAYSLSGPGQAAQMEAHAFNRTSAAHCLTLLCEVDRLRAKLSALDGRPRE